MKKALSLLLVRTMVIGLGCMAVSAESTSDEVVELEEGIYYFEDGSCLCRWLDG